MQNENMFTTREAAEYIRFAESTLTNWRGEEGKGPKHSTVSGKIFYFREDLDNWLQEQREQGN